jgi:hypothetical protein
VGLAAVSQLLFESIADHLGRRPSLLGGLARPVLPGIVMRPHGRSAGSCALTLNELK